MTRYSRIACFLVLLLLAGCSHERILGRQYVKNHTGNGVMIVPSYELYKDNLTIHYDPDLRLNPDQQDSVAWEQSLFIKHISDSVFLTVFTNSLINELNASGFDVYVEGSSDVFLSLPDPKWMVQIAQLQLNEEYTYNYFELFPVDGGEEYLDSLRINQVSLESWLDVSRANTNNKQVLYLKGYIQDDIKRGVNFNLLVGSVGLEQIRDSIGINDVYIMAKQLGVKHAGLLFDYFMNDYIRENLPSGIQNKKNFHYDRKSNSLKNKLTENFDVVN